MGEEVNKDAIRYINGDNAETELMDDGTLIVKTDDIEKVSRVMVKEKDSVFCKMFYEE